MAPGKEGAWINQLLVSPVFSPPPRLLRHDVNTHSVDTKHPEQGQRGGGAGLALRTASHSSRADEQTLLFWAAAAHPASAAVGVGQRSHLRSPRKACSGQRRGLGCCGHPPAPCLLQETASVGPVKPQRSPWGQAEAGRVPPPPRRQLSVVRRALPQGARCARASLRPTTALSSAFSLYKVMGLKGPSGTSLALRFSAVSSTLEALQAAMTVLCCDGRRPRAWEGAGVGTCVWMPLF